MRKGAAPSAGHGRNCAQRGRLPVCLLLLRVLWGLELPWPPCDFAATLVRLEGQHLRMDLGPASLQISCNGSKHPTA